MSTEERFPKYQVGDYVRVGHPSATWQGLVYRVADTGDEFEYWVQGGPDCFPGCEFPLLAWESEVDLLQTKEALASNSTVTD
jgi:hypothetical protein